MQAYFRTRHHPIVKGNQPASHCISRHPTASQITSGSIYSDGSQFSKVVCLRLFGCQVVSSKRPFTVPQHEDTQNRHPASEPPGANITRNACSKIFSHTWRLLSSLQFAEYLRSFGLRALSSFEADLCDDSSACIWDSAES
jgi:hypothetical protein